MPATWDTQLHDNSAGYPTHKSRDRVPRDGSVVIVQKIGSDDRCQVERVGRELRVWRYDPTDQVYCRVDDDYVWRGCGGFDF